MNSDALWAATQRVRVLLAQSKNPRTRMFKHSPTGVAFNVTHEAIRTYLQELERHSDRHD